MTAASTNKKSAKSAKRTTKPDVDKPGKTAPSATSKPVIVSNRPLLRDPMVVDEEAVSEKSETEKEELAHSTGPKLRPLEGPAKAGAGGGQPAGDEGTEPNPESETGKEVSTEDESTHAETKPPTGKETRPKSDDAKNAEQAKHDADIQRLIDSRKYELPINAVEKRKTKRFVALGVLLAILLTLAWADTALDAGLIRVNGVKPVTHFFSN